MVIEAGLTFFKHSLAETERIGFLHCIQIHSKPFSVRIGPVVLGAIPDYSPCGENPWEFLIGDPDQGIALSILEKDVVVGIVFLDQIVLQDQGLIFVTCNHVVDGGDLLHQSRRLGIPVGKEIGVDPSLKVLCLPYIYYSSFTVLHQVASRILRKAPCLIPCTFIHT